MFSQKQQNTEQPGNLHQGKNLLLQPGTLIASRRFGSPKRWAIVQQVTVTPQQLFAALHSHDRRKWLLSLFRSVQ